MSTNEILERLDAIETKLDAIAPKQKNDRSQFMSREQLCEELGIARRTCYLYEKRHGWTRYTLGRKTVFKRDEIEASLQAVS